MVPYLLFHTDLVKWPHLLLQDLMLRCSHYYLTLKLVCATAKLLDGHQ